MNTQRTIELIATTPLITDSESASEAVRFVMELLCDPHIVKARSEFLLEAKRALNKSVELPPHAGPEFDFEPELEAVRKHGIGDAVRDNHVSPQRLIDMILQPEVLERLYAASVELENTLLPETLKEQNNVSRSEDRRTVALNDADSIVKQNFGTENGSQLVRSSQMENEKWGTSSKSGKRNNYARGILASGIAAIVSIVGTSIYWNSKMQVNQFVAASADVKAPEGVMGDDNVSLSLIAGREGFLTVVALPATGEYIPSDCILTPEDPKDSVTQLEPGAEHKEIVPISPQTAFIVTVVTATQADHALRRQFALLEEQLAVVPNKERITALIERVLKEVGYESAEISVSAVPK